MSRTARASQANYCYHVLNRGNGKAEVFHKPEDYAAFLDLMGLASARLPMRILGYCLMPNHFHLVLWPLADGDLSRWMQWLMTSHVRRYHRHYESSGHVWQGRFRAFPIQEDAHLLTVLRYVERNPLRAGLVPQAEAWQWSSLAGIAQSKPDPLLHLPGPKPRGRRWVEGVNAPMTDAEVASVQNAIKRGSPYGSAEWASTTASALGLESTLRARGRPKGSKKPE